MSYEKFTDNARKVMQLANQEAQRLGQEFIAPEHILIGLVSSENTIPARIFADHGITSQTLRTEIEKILPSGIELVAAERLPETPNTKKVIEYAMEEAKTLHHSYVGPEHLLLGLLRIENEKSIPHQVFRNLRLNPDRIREEVLLALNNEESGRVDTKCHWYTIEFPTGTNTHRRQEVVASISRLLQIYNAHMQPNATIRTFFEEP